LIRELSPDYRCDTMLEPLEMVARRERHLPEEFTDLDRRFVSEAYLRYAKPLIGEVTPHTRFQK
jgi:hypothetical protein